MRQSMRETAHHSTTLDTCTAQVGKERALAGSVSCSEGSSAAEAGPTRVSAKPAPNRATMALGFWMAPQLVRLVCNVPCVWDWDFGVEEEMGFVDLWRKRGF